MAFDRGGAVTIATRLPATLQERGGWGDTSVPLPGHPIVDIITGRRFDGGAIEVGDLLSKYPVALLAPL